MRVRPIFLLSLLVSCAGVLIFAANFHPDVPVVVQVHLDQPHPTSHSTTNLVVHLSDGDGVPIEQAQVISHVNMTNMDMGIHPLLVREAGHGEYVEPLLLNMSGPWAITVLVQARGFVPQRQVVQVQVL